MKLTVAMLGISLTLILTSCESPVKTGYYPSGEIKYRASLNDQGKATGKVITFYKTGVTESIIPIQAHQITGLVKRYYPNGNLKSTEVYLNGRRSGNKVKYFPNGHIEYKIVLRGNIQVDTARYYYSNGDLKELAIYDRNGRKIDFIVLKHDGEMDPSYAQPIFLSDVDSIHMGQDYSFEIVLGNRHLSHITTRILTPIGKIDSIQGHYTKNRYLVRCPSRGRHVVKAELIEQWSKQGNDTVWINTFRTEHVFHVTQ